jgi:hypothetical protein
MSDYRQIVHRTYLEVLGRPADLGSLNKYTCLLKHGIINQQGIKNILIQNKDNNDNTKSKQLWISDLKNIKNLYKDYKPIDVPQEAENGIIIVETRSNPDMVRHFKVLLTKQEPVLKQCLSLVKGWTLHIFCSRKNMPFVKDMIIGWNYIHLHILDVSINGVEDYNILLKSADFWKQDYL